MRLFHQRVWSTHLHASVLCNVSGSGKTLAVLAGLREYWGFYLTAARAPGPNGVGSKDLVNAVNKMPKQAGWIIDALHCRSKTSLEASQNNEVIASREIAKVLRARYTIFQLFIEVARDVHGGLPEDVKADWMLFQSFPMLGEDVFAAFVNTCLSDVDEILLSKLDRITPENILRDHGCPFYFVLDEVQAAGEAHPQSFCDKSGVQPRPVLRPLIARLAEDNNYPIIVSGTGFSLDDIETVIESGVGKDLQWKIHHALDDLSERSTQEAYVRRYLPPAFLETKAGQLLLEKLWELCRGRLVPGM